MTIPSQIGMLPRSPKEAYLSFPAKVETGIILPESMPCSSPQEAALLIREGIMPSRSGLVRLPGGIGAFDLVAVDEATDNKITLPPSAKTAVNKKDGSIKAPGLIVLSNSEGHIRPYAYTVKSETVDWLNIRNSHDRSPRPKAFRKIGSVAVVLFSFGDVSDFDIDEIESDGTLIARKSTKFF